MIKKIKTLLFENIDDKQIVLKNSFWLILWEWFSKGATFIITILIARLLWPENFWIYSLIISFVVLFIAITDYWLTTILVKQISKNQNKLQEYLINLSFIKILLWILTFVLIYIASHFIWKDDFYIKLILIYTAYAIINNIWDFIRAFFRPSEKMQNEAFLKIINWILILSILIFIIVNKWDIENIFNWFLLAWIISLIFSVYYVLSKFSIKIRKIKLNKTIIKNSLKSWFFLLWSYLAINIFTNTDIIMLWLFDMKYDLWIYSAIFRLTSIPILIMLIITASIIPNLLKNYKLNKIKQILKYITIFSIFNIIIWLLFWWEIIKLIYWNAFVSNYSNTILIILLIKNIFGWFNILFFQYLNHKWEEKSIFYFILIVTLINIILNYYLIPIYRWIWAWLTTVIVDLVLLLLILLYHRNKIFIK